MGLVHESRGATADEEGGGPSCCVTSISALRRPVDLADLEVHGYLGRHPFWVWPVLTPLLFQIEQSDARDHCANERNFLSYLRLSMYMAVVSVAISLSFHLKQQPTDLELRMAKPLGGIFWCLSVACLGIGAGNYIKTVNKYSRRAAIVQSGWKTQTAMGIIALCIVGACVTLLIIEKLSQRPDN